MQTDRKHWLKVLPLDNAFEAVYGRCAEGERIYGDSTLHKSENAMRREALNEIYDAIAYLAFEAARIRARMTGN